MSKYQTAVTENGIQFLVTRSNGKVEALPGDFAFVQPMAADKAVESLKHEVSQRGNVTRASLSALYAILQSPRMDGYKGIGDINADDGAKLPKEIKTALRDAESAFFAPQFKDTKKLDVFLTGIRDAGIYATVKGVALKYFYFVGRLPALYEGDHPNPNKLLSVSAMQKLLAMMAEDKAPEDKSFAARVLSLQSEWMESETLKRADLELLLGNLKRFAEEVQQAINASDVGATENTALMMPAGSGDEMALQVMKAWADKEAAAEQAEEEALM